MAANAPYYHQLRGQFTTTTSADANANAPFPPVDVNDHHVFQLAAPLAPQMHHAHHLCDDSTQPDSTALHSLDESHNLVDLIEAATTAEAMNLDPLGEGAEESPDKSTHSQNCGSKRKRVESSPAPEAEGEATTHKRARADLSTDPRLHDHESASNTPTTPPSSETLLQDARAAGVHSAAALFRRSVKEPTRKYTRPPMSKLFMSLQLSPENFLQLQARAKSYMLDPSHPERQSCVGNRGRGDTDMVKLKLFNCVRDFLSDGVGEQFFGENVEKPAEKEALEAARALGEKDVVGSGEKLCWPRDGNKIISLVTPLLRRMVTNERQRQYAIETRKGGGRKKEEGCAGTPQSMGESGGMHMGEDNSHAVSYTPSRTQHLPSETPVSSVEVHHYPITTQTLSAHSSPAPQSTTSRVTRSLPGHEDRVFDLRTINIFIARNNIKLKPCDKITGPDPLIHLTWDQLQQRVQHLVKRAVATYPELEQGGRRIQDELPDLELGSQLKEMGPEALRGLAVAATEIQNVPGRADSMSTDFRGHVALQTSNEGLISGTSPIDASKENENSMQAPREAAPVPQPAQHHTSAPSDLLAISLQAPPPSPSKLFATQVSESQARGMVSKAQALGAEPQLPKYGLKVMLTTGLTPIVSEQEWEKAKMEIGYAVWASGKLTVVGEV